MKFTFLAPVLAVSLLSACASTSVDTDFDPSVSFSNFKSYAWLQQPTDAPPLVQQRIVSDIDAQLQSKGWRRVASASQADVGVAAHVTTEQKQTLDTFYTGPSWQGWGWGGGWGPGWGGGMGMSTTSVYTYEVGTLIVDMFDTKTQKAIWRGQASGTIPSSSERLNEGVQEAVVKMFAAFPPGSTPKK